MREGFYVHMGPPEMMADIEIDEAGNILITNQVFRLNYHFEPFDPKRVKEVDYRDEMTKRRSPHYQPPGGASWPF